MRAFSFIAMILVLGSAAGETLPQGASFVGLVNGEWQLFIVEATSAVRAVRTQGEPRTPVFSARLQRAAYISAAGELREVDLQSATDAVLLKPSAKVAYTQPVYRPQSDELYVVALRDASSIETDIARVDRTAHKAVTVLQQRSAQFEPTFSADGEQLFYSNVACASECPKVLQEIWAMDVIGGIAEQRTLLNSISRQPISAADGTVLFISNARGTYELWRSTAIGKAEPVARTEGLAESPIVTEAREIFFIRRTRQGGSIVRLADNGGAHPVALPKNVKDVRDLRWGGP